MSEDIVLPIKDEKNFMKILYLIGFKDWYIVPELRSMPLWYQLLIMYPDRLDDFVFLLDKFGIERPPYITEIRFPEFYTEEELDALFENKKKINILGRYGDDYCRYSGYYSSFKPFEFDLIKALNKEEDFFNSITLYWSSFLKNKLLTTDKYFKKIIDGLRTGDRYIEYRDFIEIHEFQELSLEQYEELSEFVHFSPHTVEFFEKGMLLGSEIIAKKFFEHADKFYKQYKFDAMPDKYQAIYIEELEDENEKLEFLKRAKLSKEEKMKILSTIV